MGEAGSSRACLTASPACLTGSVCCSLPQVLDGLLAQYGTVENVEQGEIVQRGGLHQCRSPSATPPALPVLGRTQWSGTWFS